MSAIEKQARAALVALRAFAAQYMADVCHCDHAAGICHCGVASLIADADSAIGTFDTSLAAPVAQQAEPVAQPDLLDAVEAYLEAQGALDNRELMGPNAEPHEVLNRRRRDAYAALDDAIIAAKKRAAQPVAPAGWQPADDVVGYVARWGGNCRDCADENGVCPNTGLPCGGYRRAIEHVIKALRYGVQHGYIGNPLATAPTQEVPRHE